MTTEQLSKAIRAYLEAVLAAADAAGTMCASEQNPGFFVLDGISSNPIYVGRKSATFIVAARTVTPQMAESLLGELTAHEERLAELPQTRNLGDPDLSGFEVFYKVWHTVRIRDMARELGLLEANNDKN